MADTRALRQDISRITAPGSARLTAAVEDLDKVIATLEAARKQVAEDSSIHAANHILPRLLKPISEQFDAVTDDLRKVDKVRKDVGKSIDKRFPLKPLPAGKDPLAKHSGLINSAIAMHLVRDGQTDVVRALNNDLWNAEIRKYRQDKRRENWELAGERQDDVMEDVNVDLSHARNGATGMTDAEVPMPDRDSADDLRARLQELESSMPSRDLEVPFAEMYGILQQIEQRNLKPAMRWVKARTAALFNSGSELEFELDKLEYLWQCRGPLLHEQYLKSQRMPISNPLSSNLDFDLDSDDDEDDGLISAATMAGYLRAFAYARANFPRWGATRHALEINHLSTAPIFTSTSPATNPYAATTQPDMAAAFQSIAHTFQRDFCALLGLSPESPLYLATTAGAIALPRHMKYAEAVKLKHTEWTTAQELAFETPLPPSMVYHSIFVCPVSKEQTTEVNPPVLLPCGHVLAKESLARLVKGASPKFKCPYCPAEGYLKDAKQIVF